MSYRIHFRLADEYLDHIDRVIGSEPNPFIQSRYIGFLAVSAVTVYELSIKTIFFEFAQKKHKVFASFTKDYFNRLNGRIKIAELRDNYILRFGVRYRERFDRNLGLKEEGIMQSERESIRTCYNNVIVWRHKFAHEGTIPNTATYQEARKSYIYGKYVLECLAETMKR